MVLANNTRQPFFRSERSRVPPPDAIFLRPAGQYKGDWRRFRARHLRRRAPSPALWRSSARRRSRTCRGFFQEAAALPQFRSKRRLLASTISCSARAARKRAAGQPSLSAVAAETRPDQPDAGKTQLAEQQVHASGSILSLVFMLPLPETRNVSTTLRQPAFEFKLGFPAFGLAG